jgi:dienelactone hydrolase
MFSLSPTGKEAGFEVDADGHVIGAYLTGEVVGPSGRLILLIPDCFGWRLPQTRRLADVLASSLSGLVCLPDVHRGSALDEYVCADTLKGASAFREWYSSNAPARVVSDLASVLDALGPAKDIKQLVIVGLGWGGRFGLELLASGRVPAHALVSVASPYVTAELVAKVAARGLRALVLARDAEGAAALAAAAGTGTIEVGEAAAAAAAHATLSTAAGFAEGQETFLRTVGDFVTRSLLTAGL